MSELEPSYINERVRQLLRTLSELEEKYSVRSSRLLSEQGTVRDLMSKSEKAREEVERWIALYVELARLREIRSMYSRSTRTR